VTTYEEMHMSTKTMARGRWIEPVARAGYITHGIVYVLVGALAVMFALGRGGALGEEEAAEHVGRAPFGEVLLLLAGVGLFAFAAWRLIQALFDPDHEGTGGKALAKRLGYGVSCVLHVFAGITALQLAMGERRGGSHASYLGRVLASDVGPIIVAAAGVAILLYAAYELHRAWTAKLMENLRTAQMSPTERTWAVRIGRAGLAARAVVLILIGVGLVRAAVLFDPSRAETMGSALREIASKPFGTVLLVVIALGLGAYGIASFVEARYRRIPA
jgi:hypothetical protein